MNLSQAKPASRLRIHEKVQWAFAVRSRCSSLGCKPVDKVNKLGDADGSQSHWLSDTVKNRFFILFVYN